MAASVLSKSPFDPMMRTSQSATSSGGASRDSLEGLALVRPLRGKRPYSHLCKTRIFARYEADGARIVDTVDVLSKTYGRPILTTPP